MYQAGLDAVFHLLRAFIDREDRLRPFKIYLRILQDLYIDLRLKSKVSKVASLVSQPSNSPATPRHREDLRFGEEGTWGHARLCVKFQADWTRKVREPCEGISKYRFTLGVNFGSRFFAGISEIPSSNKVRMLLLQVATQRVNVLAIPV